MTDDETRTPMWSNRWRMAGSAALMAVAFLAVSVVSLFSGEARRRYIYLRVERILADD